MSIYFSKESRRSEALSDWWGKLESNRGDRAQLKRAASLTDVALTSAYQRLCRRLSTQDWSAQDRDRFAAVAGLLAHVKVSDARRPEKAMSERKPGDDKPPVSELRFMRLLESRNLDDLFPALRRVLPLMEYRVNIIELANDLMHFDDEDGKVKKQWAYGYEWPDK